MPSMTSSILLKTHQLMRNRALQKRLMNRTNNLKIMALMKNHGSNLTTSGRKRKRGNVLEGPVSEDEDEDKEAEADDARSSGKRSKASSQPPQNVLATPQGQSYGLSLLSDTVKWLTTSVRVDSIMGRGQATTQGNQQHDQLDALGLVETNLPPPAPMGSRDEVHSGSTLDQAAMQAAASVELETEAMPLRAFTGESIGGPDTRNSNSCTNTYVRQDILANETEASNNLERSQSWWPHLASQVGANQRYRDFLRRSDQVTREEDESPESENDSEDDVAT